MLRVLLSQMNELFIMNGTNHSMNGITTYPFHIFGCG